MSWDWVGTVAVALVGVAATLLGAALNQRHADRQAAAARQDARRQERLTVYADAIAHVMAEELRLDTVEASSAEGYYYDPPNRPGGQLRLGPMDAVSVQMHLLANDEVRRAWLFFIAAWENYDRWAADQLSSSVEAQAPEELIVPLREAIQNMKSTCKQDLG